MRYNDGIDESDRLLKSGLKIERRVKVMNVKVMNLILVV